jgi:uncharacterized membrane protein
MLTTGIAWASSAAAIALFSGTASAQPLRYVIQDLTELGQPIGVVQCEARAVNEAGLAAGFEVLPEFRERGLTWSGGVAGELPLLPGDNSSRAMGVTESGELLGVSDLVEVVVVGHQLRIYQDQKAVAWAGPGGPVERIADRVTGGAPINLQVAIAENASGVMIGWGDVPDPGPGARLAKGWLLEGGDIVDLGALTRPRAVNDRGEVAGHTNGGQAKAIVWRNGSTTNLHEHPSIGGVTSRAYGIDPTGEMIVGEAQFSISNPEEPALWVGGVPQRLVPEVNRPQGVASAINASGDIVGYFSDLDRLNEPFHGVIWTGGQRLRLLDLLVRIDGWEVLYPFDINDRGVIVGGGIRNGEIGHGFMMTPLCYADCTGEGALDVFDFLCFQDAFVQGDPYADCDESGSLDVFDFLCFQDAFVRGCP